MIPQKNFFCSQLQSPVRSQNWHTSALLQPIEDHFKISNSARGNDSKFFSLEPAAASAYIKTLARSVIPRNSCHCSQSQFTITSLFWTRGQLMKSPPIPVPLLHHFNPQAKLALTLDSIYPPPPRKDKTPS